ncbi:hypothetical protein HYQ44_014274 [Verticillium longisporum]|nr:hypothetical protein HYQ44_014274 [Verticillium longisporum]
MCQRQAQTGSRRSSLQISGKPGSYLEHRYTSQSPCRHPELAGWLGAGPHQASATSRRKPATGIKTQSR